MPSDPRSLSQAEEDEAREVTPIDAGLMLDAVFRLARAAFRIANIRLRPWGLTLSSYAAMRVIADQPQLSLAQVSRRCFARPQTMIRIVRELEARGLVRRSEHEDSRRAMALSLTAEGLVAVREMGAAVSEIDTTLGRVLTPENVSEIDDVLRRCAVLVERETERLARAGDVTAP